MERDVVFLDDADAGGDGEGDGHQNELGLLAARRSRRWPVIAGLAVMTGLAVTAVHGADHPGPRPPSVPSSAVTSAAAATAPPIAAPVAHFVAADGSDCPEGDDGESRCVTVPGLPRRCRAALDGLVPEARIETARSQWVRPDAWGTPQRLWFRLVTAHNAAEQVAIEVRLRAPHDAGYGRVWRGRSFTSEAQVVGASYTITVRVVSLRGGPAPLSRLRALATDPRLLAPGGRTR